MIKISTLSIPDYEIVIEGVDEASGLHAFIAVHNTSLGPSLGGVRIHSYSSREEALQDCLRLAKAMTYKSAICQDGLGGGKAVIIADPKTQKTKEMLHAFGEMVESLKGKYIAAEDVGTNLEDMLFFREKTRYVAALPTKESSGDPSRFTAWGVFRGIEAVCQILWGDSSAVRGKKIALQGLGNVGSKVADLLFWRGAQLIVCDVDAEKTEKMRSNYGAQVIPTEDFIATSCDILCPCALGGTVDDESIPLLQCQAIAGAANNQLLLPEHGYALQRKKILYAPDFVINAGGIINAASEFNGPYDPAKVRDKVDLIYESLLQIFAKAQAEERSTSSVADELAEYNLRYGIGKRAHPIPW